jgi:hypothetical protein
MRVAPCRNTTSPFDIMPSWSRPRAFWKRSTAAVVAQSQWSSTSMS